jgi:hypothetical protein
MRSDHGDREHALAATAWPAWTVAAVWTVAPTPGQAGKAERLVVRSHKRGRGVEVIGEGAPIPWHVRRGDGWTCAASNVPMVEDEPLSPWLAEAVGASWKAVR